MCSVTIRPGIIMISTGKFNFVHSQQNWINLLRLQCVVMCTCVCVWSKYCIWFCQWIYIITPTLNILYTHSYQFYVNHPPSSSNVYVLGHVSITLFTWHAPKNFGEINPFCVSVLRLNGLSQAICQENACFRYWTALASERERESEKEWETL